MAHLSIFGDDYDTMDGTGISDYIHVSDLADGHDQPDTPARGRREQSGRGAAGRDGQARRRGRPLLPRGPELGGLRGVVEPESAQHRLTTEDPLSAARQEWSPRLGLPYSVQHMPTPPAQRLRREQR